MRSKFGGVLILVCTGNNRPVSRLEEYHSHVGGQEVEPGGRRSVTFFTVLENI